MAQKNARILVIDDERLVRDNVVRLLSLEGYVPSVAENGEQGIEMALRSPPDLILCDLMMPKVDGFGVLARLRAEPATAGTPFIFLTASADAEDSRVAQLLGASDYLTKPFSLGRLRELIAQRLAEAGTPFIFLTASADAEDSRVAQLLGASDYLTKPFSLGRLRELIAQRLAEAGR